VQHCRRHCCIATVLDVVHGNAVDRAIGDIIANLAAFEGKFRVNRRFASAHAIAANIPRIVGNIGQNRGKPRFLDHIVGNGGIGRHADGQSAYTCPISRTVSGRL
jgi:hypothetical protein